MIEEFDTFMWTNRRFLNNQIIIKLLFLIAQCKINENGLQRVFAYVHFLAETYSTQLYREVKEQIEELINLEAVIKKGNIHPKEDGIIVNFVMNGIFLHFTGENVLIK